MSQKLTCFVIAPLGETGSQTRQDSDDLLELVIKPVMEVFDIEVIRGDHRNESGQIDVDVIKLVQESELCIADLSLENVNVYYELGRRDETGRPIILLKSVNSEDLPVDVATRRYIEFDLDSRRALIVTREKIKEAVQELIDSGMEKTKGTSLFAISEKIDRIERGLNRLLEQPRYEVGQSGTVNSSEWDEEEPATLLRVALIDRNIPQAEYAMEKLKNSMNVMAFYDQVVEVVAGLGSRKAGMMLIDFMDSFIDQEADLNKKIEYIGYLVTYLNRTDQEAKYLDQVEPSAMRIKDEEGNVPHQVYNQLNRLHYGIYATNNDIEHLNYAIMYLGKAIEVAPQEASYHYNLAMCYKSKVEESDDMNESEKKEMLEQACMHSLKAVELDGTDYDEDHVAMACRLCYLTDNAEWRDYFDVLKKNSPNRAKLLRRELK